MNEFTFTLTLILSLSSPPVQDHHLQLVKLLAHDDYSTRQKAHDTLTLYKLKARPSLVIGCKSNDLETRRRCERLLNEAVEEELKSYGEFPWIDSWWMKPDEVSYTPSMEDSPLGLLNRTYSPYLQMAWGSSGNTWDDYRVATRLMVRDWVEIGVPRWWISGVLDHMKKNDARWLAHMNRGGPEMLPPPAPQPMPPPPPPN